MENKINLIELLKDCPKGMELDCTMFDNVKFDHVDTSPQYPICITVGEERHESLTKYGEWIDNNTAKCVIFPKGKTSWKGFQKPFKDGDILVGHSGRPFIFKSLNNSNGCCSYCGIDFLNIFKLDSNDWTFADSLRYASEEEKEKLFQVIKDNGYEWNPENKTLEKLIKPKFKVGDSIRKRGSASVYEITYSDEGEYQLDEKDIHVPWDVQDEWELVPNKFDINTLKPFESKVLVRDNNTETWEGAIFSHCEGKRKFIHTIGGTCWVQCVPYEENKHLLGTTNDCDEFYKNW